jgi:hypothetical protein
VVDLVLRKIIYVIYRVNVIKNDIKYFNIHTYK